MTFTTIVAEILSGASAGTLIVSPLSPAVVSSLLPLASSVAAVPLASAPPYAAANQVAAIYALAPSGAKPSQKVGVSLRNSAGLPAAAAVDVLVLSDDYFSTPPSVGTLVLAAAAHVSADGATIQTDAGEGISEITWLAVRQKGNVP